MEAQATTVDTHLTQSVQATISSSAAATRMWNAKNSLLLCKLPGEIRNSIYRYVLLRNEIIFDLADIHAATPLLRASSQLRDEAKVVFYSENKFVITRVTDQQSDVEKFLEWVGKDNTHHLPLILLRTKPPVKWSKVWALYGYYRGEEGLRSGEAGARVSAAIGGDQTDHFSTIVVSIVASALREVEAVARTLVEYGVPFARIQADDLGMPTGRERLAERASKAMSVKLTDAFLKIAWMQDPQWNRLTEEERSVAFAGNVFGRYLFGLT